MALRRRRWCGRQLGDDVSCSDGTAPICTDRKVMPRNRQPRYSHPDERDTGVLAARHVKAVMPLEIASTPVRAVVPLAKAEGSRREKAPGRSPRQMRRVATTPSVPSRYFTNPIDCQDIMARKK